ncbi:hypothetical protein CP985_13590 [Malaciobacter mytili LMG 24559]|uniref:Uncharacterized protein n=1 Tax=Malaciobacter mytili LMG 24559 TaxID=1032238 RepID=A0AAX2ABR0_9BACT|nr:hypothetical protein [Malaciobacter mytili]AXH16455.1 hypothetical protein AMYT_a0157 [Malaciobacter mytili LMG 24559]RXK12983.1 hypothetical protein CP985_13590 [Malaciobacter mytili LMG 24559]
MSDLIDCSLPKKLEDKYEKYEHYFDWYRLNRFEDKTEFYLIGVHIFTIEEKLSDEDIIKYVNLYEWAFRNGFEKGTKSTQEKIKSALGI